MKYTLQEIGTRLDAHIEQQTRTEADLTASLDRIEKCVIIGNGEPALKEQVHKTNEWICGANRLVWIFVGILAGQLVIGACGLVSIVITLAYRGGVLP